jgi:hypothetical protein
LLNSFRHNTVTQREDSKSNKIRLGHRMGHVQKRNKARRILRLLSLRSVRRDKQRTPCFTGRPITQPFSQSLEKINLHGSFLRDTTSADHVFARGCGCQNRINASRLEQCAERERASWPDPEYNMLRCPSHHAGQCHQIRLTNSFHQAEGTSALGFRYAIKSLQ